MSNSVFVGNIPPHFDDSELVELFRITIGETPNVINRRRNFAFLELSSEASAAVAVAMINGVNIMGSNLIVEPVVPQPQSNARNRSCSLQISNIPESQPWDSVHQLLSSFGNIQACDKGSRRPDNTFSVAVTYETPDQAQQAHSQLNNLEIEAGYFLRSEYMMNRGRSGNRSNRMNANYYQSPVGSGYADFPLRMLVLSDMVGAIIGRGGGTIRQITQQSRARVDIHRRENAGSLEKVITIYGNPENRSTACQKILEIIQQESTAQGRGEVVLKLLAHNNLIGRLIGKNGSTIKRMMEQTDTKITVSSFLHDINHLNVERVITIKGSLENIAKAEQLVSTKLRQSYENDIAAASQPMMYPGIHSMPMPTIGAPAPPFPHPRAGGGMPPPPFMYGSPNYPTYPIPVPPYVSDVSKEVVVVFIPNGSVGAIIGTGGSTIREMISASNASIKVAQARPDEPLDKTSLRRVTIIGSPEAQWQAQYMIFKKIGFDGPGCQEAHLKVEINIPTSLVGRVIGKGGMTIKEIQRTTGAAVKFPEESQNAETEETPVHIIGDFYSTQAAQQKIRGLIASQIVMNNQRRRPSVLPPQPPSQN